jgi:4a-hydroxytetrahydrobiopterin dehydratase
MRKYDKLSDAEIASFVAAHPGWQRSGEMLQKSFEFKHYGQAMGFAVHMGFAAEKRDHHPNLHVYYGKVTVEWTTHDAGGITNVDAEMAALTDHLYER